MSICAGELRHWVTLQKPAETVNEKGKRIPGWKDVARVKAGKADVSGREFYVAQAHHAEDAAAQRSPGRSPADHLAARRAALASRFPEVDVIPLSRNPF